MRRRGISISSSGSNTIIAAPGAGKCIYIDHINLFPSNSLNVQLWNGPSSTGTALSGVYPLTTGQALVFENSPQLEHGILECSDNKAFVINLGSAVSCTGFLRYRIQNE